MLQNKWRWLSWNKVRCQSNEEKWNPDKMKIINSWKQFMIVVMEVVYGKVNTKMMKCLYICAKYPRHNVNDSSANFHITQSSVQVEDILLWYKVCFQVITVWFSYPRLLPFHYIQPYCVNIRNPIQLISQLLSIHICTLISMLTICSSDHTSHSLIRHFLVYGIIQLFRYPKQM